MSMNGTKERATILQMDVEDVQGIRVAHLERIPGRGLVKVTGKNGAGKSSLLKAIRGAMGGKAEVHERVVNDASEDGKASVEIVLSNGWRLVRRHTEANPKGSLTVEGPDGGKHGQTRLNEMLGPLSFDPLAFFGLKPERQREILLSLGTDPDLPGKLDGIRADRSALEEERRPFNSELQRIQRTEKPEGARPEPVDVSTETKRLQELQAAQREHQDIHRAVARAQDGVGAAQASVDQAEARIRKLEEELAAARTQRDEQVRLREEAKARLRDAQATADASTDPTPDIEAIMARLDQASAVERALEPWKEWDRAQARVKEVKVQSEALTIRIDALKEQEQELMASAALPVPGLTFDDAGEPMLNNRPLALASGGERIRCAVAVAIAADSDVGICLIDEANDLDPEGLEELDRLGHEHGFQIWSCRIGLEGPGDVVVADGHASTPGAPVATGATTDAEREAAAAGENLEF